MTNPPKSNRLRKDLTIIGPAILDVLAGPVNPTLFQIGTQPMQTSKLSFGGDALNEAVVLTRLGKQVELITKIGQDEAGSRILDYLRANGLSVDSVLIEPGLQTGINIVLFDPTGERYFLTNPQGSLRKLSEQDLDLYLDHAADIVCFASMFISPLLDIPAMERIFKRIKQKPGRILAADLTKAKNGETLEQLRNVLSQLDYMFPNEAELSLLTGETDPYKNTKLLVNAGVSCAVLKLGSKGCLIRTATELFEIPAYPDTQVVDTTGAGDCFAAGFLWALSEGFSLEDCGRFACAAASCSVEQVGATEGIRSLEQPLARYRMMCASNIARK